MLRKLKVTFDMAAVGSTTVKRNKARPQAWLCFLFSPCQTHIPWQVPGPKVIIKEQKYAEN